tara:strand:- start:798 stop:1547 length:750 start_codon:yes stop_codon:yes gene_type:complete
VREAFSCLRECHTNQTIDSYRTDAASTGEFDSFEGMPTPSWEFYYTAAEEETPTYRVELAKSNRSACSAKGKAKRCMDPVPTSFSSSSSSSPLSKAEQGAMKRAATKERNNAKIKIPKGAVRIGSLDKDHGNYGRWVHLTCWRVPSKIWLGLPDPETCTDESKFEQALIAMNSVLLCGVHELQGADRSAFVQHTMVLCSVLCAFFLLCSPAGFALFCSPSLLSDQVFVLVVVGSVFVCVLGRIKQLGQN